MPPSRRLEDRIRQLCIRVRTRASFASDHELALIVAELQMAMREYTQRASNRTAATVFRWPHDPQERRSA